MGFPEAGILIGIIGAGFLVCRSAAAKLPLSLEPEATTILIMKIQYPPVGSKWKERDLRVGRTVQVVRYDLAKRRVRIVCLETERLTWAKPERFDGKSGGYAMLSPPIQHAESRRGKALRI
jgi:hypothetical protein